MTDTLQLKTDLALAKLRIDDLEQERDRACKRVRLLETQRDNALACFVPTQLISMADPVGIEPRSHALHVEAVERFSQAMVQVLDANAHKAHWRTQDKGFLIARLHQESAELLEAFTQGTPGQVRHEAVDVANLAMMIFDHLEGTRDSDE
jgi:NTP pyrophosphatase (non-canonical NTP hydrolase)